MNEREKGESRLIIKKNAHHTHYFCIFLPFSMIYIYTHTHTHHLVIGLGVSACAKQQLHDVHVSVLRSDKKRAVALWCVCVCLCV